MPHTSAATPTRTSRHLPTRRRGCTLIEAMCTLAITLVLLSGALPMLKDLLARQTLLAQAAELETDLVLARAQALIHLESIRFSVHQTAAGASCYVVYSGPAGSCDCLGSGQSRCEDGGQVLRVADTSRRAGITLANLARPLTFDAGLGTVTPTATLRLSDNEGRTVHQVINLVGRVRTCTPNPSWGGLRRC